MLGARIAALRRRAGWSQAELAKRLRISASAVGMYEQGRREPSADTLVELAKLFGVSTDYLLTGQALAPGDRDAAAQAVSRCVESAHAILESRPRQPLSREELAMLFAAILSES